MAQEHHGFRKRLERRSQSQRRAEMRKRLLVGTTRSLARHGYSGTSITTVCEMAGVTRGAFNHYYASLNEAVLDAAEAIIRRSFKRLGIVLLNTAEADDRIENLVKSTWRHVFLGTDGAVMHDLIAATRTDAELSRHMSELWTRLSSLFDEAARHYFMPREGVEVSVEDLLHLHLWQLKGMLADYAIDRERVDRSIDLWIKAFRHLVVAKPGVTQPPQLTTWQDERP